MPRPTRPTRHHPSPAGPAVLDVGCGDGALLPHLLRAGADAGRYLGIDLSARMVAAAAAAHPAATFRRAARLLRPSAPLAGGTLTPPLPRLPTPRTQAPTLWSSTRRASTTAACSMARHRSAPPQLAHPHPPFSSLRPGACSSSGAVLLRLPAAEQAWRPRPIARPCARQARRSSSLTRAASSARLRRPSARGGGSSSRTRKARGCGGACERGGACGPLPPPLPRSQGERQRERRRLESPFAAKLCQRKRVWFAQAPPSLPASTAGTRPSPAPACRRQRCSSRSQRSARCPAPHLPPPCRHAGRTWGTLG